MSITDRLAPLAVALLLGVSASGCSDNRPPTASEEQDRNQSLPAVVPADLSDRHPSTTAQDWVTYADFVGVVTMIGERIGEPDPEEVERGEGDLDRIVEMRVDRVLWSAPQAKTPPATLDYAGLGLLFVGGDTSERAQMVASDRPRLETGHTYVMAFRWQPTVCYEGDGVIPGHWNGLGSGSVLPYDEGALGVGEFAGQERTVTAAKVDAATLADNSLAAQVVGRPATAVTTLLRQALPGKVLDEGPMPSDC